jgi:hypothetical protein
MSAFATTVRGLFSALLVLCKSFALLGPLILLVSDGLAAALLVPLGLVLSFLLLTYAGLRQLFSTQPRKAAYSNLIFAGIALVWLVVFLLLLGSLSHI